jgi:cytidylate kinase
MGSGRARVIITIDGPAGTGKSTVAHRLADRLGLEFLDTGAMYRAAALVAIELSLPLDDGGPLADALRSADLHFDWDTTPPRVMLGDRDVSAAIREPGVAAVVSRTSALREVRQVLVEQQRRIADRHPRLVTEGRDQGSVVFPDASLRFYLDADVAVRAQRRADQLAAVGKPVDEDEVISGIRERDRLDSSRSDGPLIRPEGAVTIDTSERNVEQVVECLESIARERLPDAGLRA